MGRVPAQQVRRNAQNTHPTGRCAEPGGGSLLRAAQRPAIGAVGKSALLSGAHDAVQGHRAQIDLYRGGVPGARRSRATARGQVGQTL